MVNEQSRKKLKKQLIDQHGKLVYSFTTDEKEIYLISLSKKIRQITSIVLSTLTVSPAFITVFGECHLWKYFSAIAGVILMCISVYNLNDDSDKNLDSLKKSSNSLWLLREKYVALLTDFDSLSIDEIKEKRDKLVVETNGVYKTRIKTSRRAYKMAQKALKKEEEQSFRYGEAEKLLPESIRYD